MSGRRGGFVEARVSPMGGAECSQESQIERKQRSQPASRIYGEAVEWPEWWEWK